MGRDGSRNNTSAGLAWALSIVVFRLRARRSDGWFATKSPQLFRDSVKCPKGKLHGVLLMESGELHVNR
jgi:hypothetical protein